MLSISRKQNRKAFTLVDYVIVLGVAYLVFVGMNTYIKRGIQARIKDCADYFISQNQEEDANANVYTDSVSKTNASASVDSRMFTGGGTRVSFTQDTKMYQVSRTIETDDSYIPPFVSSTEGAFANLEYNSNTTANSAE
jgi:hypothetical protein